jgi:hypothetical protein
MIKRLMNGMEKITYEILFEVCNRSNAFIYPKIRLADIFHIKSSGIADDEYRFALQSHFDFVITNSEDFPLFAVEFDGESHEDIEQKERDEKKNRLCKKFKFPLLRISSEYINQKYGSMTILNWFIEVWFAGEYFRKAQETGQIPYDEPFMPMSFACIPGYQLYYPLFLSKKVRNKMFELFEKGQTIDLMPSLWIYRDEQNMYYSISWILIDSNNVAYVTNRMIGQFFPAPIDELLDEITIINLYSKLEDILNGNSKAISLDKLNEIINFHNRSYKCVSFMGSLYGMHSKT